MKKTVHFVGFRTDAQYSAAVRVFGKPDFIHLIHDYRMYGDTGYPIDPKTEIVVFGKKGYDKPDPNYNDQDHMRH